MFVTTEVAQKVDKEEVQEVPEVSEVFKTEELTSMCATTEVAQKVDKEEVQEVPGVSEAFKTEELISMCATTEVSQIVDQEEVQEVVKTIVLESIVGFIQESSKEIEIDKVNDSEHERILDIKQILVPKTIHNTKPENENRQSIIQPEKAVYEKEVNCEPITKKSKMTIHLSGESKTVFPDVGKTFRNILYLYFPFSLTYILILRQGQKSNSVQ